MEWQTTNLIIQIIRERHLMEATVDLPTHPTKQLKPLVVQINKQTTNSSFTFRQGLKPQVNNT